MTKKWATWTSYCTGCLETVDGHIPYSNGEPWYTYDEKAGCYRGSGCRECGYTGKRVQKYLIADLEKEL